MDDTGHAVGWRGGFTLSTSSGKAASLQLDEKLMYLEFMPRTMNRKKGDGMCQWQRALEAVWRAAGLPLNIALAPA